MPSMSCCKVPNKRGQMVTVKSVFMNFRLFNSRPSVLRGLSTSVDVDIDLNQEVILEKRVVVMDGKTQMLYQRLSALGWKKGYVAQTINAYIREGKTARKDILESCIKELRRYKKHHLALEILEWMEKRKMNFGFADYARRLDLTAKVHGIAAAEKYFDGLSPSQKNRATYGALLNCYCKEKMAEKACDIFEKMDEMEIGINSLAFNNLMSLYMRLGQPEKVPPLVLAMKEREIRLSTFTYNIWMSSYSSMDDINGVERVFEEIKKNDEKQCDWTTYSNLAVAYVKAGLNEKVEQALKQCEQKMKARPHDPEAYSWLITLYAKISNHDDVHRVWKSLKSNVSVSNINYLTMIQALFKLNDFKAMKKCFKEWESTCSYYDIRLVNAVLDGYIKHHMIEEAKTILSRALERSNGPFFIAYEKLMAYCLNTEKIELALEFLKEAIPDGDSQWYPRPEYVCKFFSYYKQKQDVDGAEKVCKYLRKLKPHDYDVYKMLLQTYIAAGRTDTDMSKRIEEDGVELTLELQNLLQNVCPQYI